MSKLLLFDFECQLCALIHEELVPSTVKLVRCPRCTGCSVRQISPVRIDRIGMALQSGASPTSIDYFERIHRERKIIEDKHYATHGDYGSHAGSDGGRPVTPEIAATL